MIIPKYLNLKYTALFFVTAVLIVLLNYTKIDIDYVIIYLYLVVIIIAGFIFNKRTKTFNDYSTGNKNISFSVILLSFLATQIGGGSTFGTTAEIYTKGIIFALASLGYVAAIIFTAHYLAPNFHNKYKSAITVSDLIKNYYGSKSERLSAIVAFLFGAGVLSTQMMALGYMFKTFLGLDYRTGVLASGLIVIMYSTFGGIWAVAVTDVIQFILLATAIPLLCGAMVRKAGGIFDILSYVPDSHIQIFSNINFYEFVCLFFFCATPFHLLQPATVQRCLILHDESKIKKMFYTYGVVKAALIIILSIIALSSLVIFSNIDPKQIIYVSISNFFPPVLKGVTICGIIAVIMSTADSHLNSSSVLMVHNILKIKKYKLSVVKITSFSLGLLSLFIALLDINIIKMIIFFELLYSLGIGIPLVYAMLSKRISPGIFYIAFLVSSLLLVFFYLVRNEVSFYTPILIVVIIQGIVLIYSYVERRYVNTYLLGD